MTARRLPSLEKQHAKAMQAYADKAEGGTSDEEEVAKIFANRPPAPVPAVAKMPATKKRKSTAVQSEGAAVFNLKEVRTQEEAW
jgi:hypothetical protein